MGNNIDKFPPDLKIGSFSNSPPWIVKLDNLPWRSDVEALRRAVYLQVPGLIRRRYIPPGARVIKVSVQLAKAIGGWYLIDRRKLKKQRKLNKRSSRRALSRRIKNAFQALGPTYIKLGQVISSGEGLFPEELVSEFSLLRDQVPAESFETVRTTVEEELGKPLNEIFKYFEPTPLAAASIAQVHAAGLISGEDVVVKVQRPQIAEQVKKDLAAMSWVAPLLAGHIAVAALANPSAIIELFAQTVVEELDFRLEADNMLEIAKVLAATKQRIMLVPRPHPELVTQKVLVMERLEGFNWSDAEGMKVAGIDTELVIRAGMTTFLEGAMFYGIFHGDLHGGNLFVQTDGRVAMMDFGITARLDEKKRLAFLKLLIGTITNDVVSRIEALKDFGAIPYEIDNRQVIKDLKLDQPVADPTQMSGEELTKEMRDLMKALLGYGAKMPKELMLFLKDLLFLDGAIATLAPDIDLLDEITNLAIYLMQNYSEQIAKDTGVDLTHVKIDIEQIKAAVGIPSNTDKLSYRDLKERRETVQHTLEETPISIVKEIITEKPDN
ncbi:MAG: AarF/UbiB family protein [Actinobacteria bacterium]|nr:AarF/UbiB family protein [Actinomycetota bacterium]